MDNDKKGVKITFETEKATSAWESPYFDVPLEDILEGFYGCCISQGWLPITLLNGMREFVNDRIDVQLPISSTDIGDAGVDEL